MISSLAARSGTSALLASIARYSAMTASLATWSERGSVISRWTISELRFGVLCCRRGADRLSRLGYPRSGGGDVVRQEQLEGGGVGGADAAAADDVRDELRLGDVLDRDHRCASKAGGIEDHNVLGDRVRPEEDGGAVWVGNRGEPEVLVDVDIGELHRSWRLHERFELSDVLVWRDGQRRDGGKHGLDLGGGGNRGLFIRADHDDSRSGGVEVFEERRLNFGL